MSAQPEARPPAADVRLRRLRPEDLPDVLRIERASFSVPWSETTFRNLFLHPDADLLAAERNGALVGYAILWTIADQAELGNVAVAPEARRQGVGERLVRAALAAARRRGAREIFLEVRESNVGAQALYRRCGFEVVGQRRRYYTHPTEDALVMRRPLLDTPPPSALL